MCYCVKSRFCCDLSSKESPCAISCSMWLCGLHCSIIVCTWTRSNNRVSKCSSGKVTFQVFPLSAIEPVMQVACIKLFDQAQKALKDPSALPEAQRLQGIIARADFTIAKASIAGTKFLLEKLHGYGGLPRRPLPPFPTESAERLWKHPDVRALLDLEVRCLEEKLAM